MFVVCVDVDVDVLWFFGDDGECFVFDDLWELLEWCFVYVFVL